MFLNADCPPGYCFLRKEFLYNLESHHGELMPVCIFGVAAIQNRAIGFHCYTDEGAMIWRLPIHAFCWKQDAPPAKLEILECWDALSYDLSAVAFEQLKGMRCQTFLKDGSKVDAEYVFTIDFCKSQASESGGDGGHKCAHLLRLDNGNFALQPNNRIFWRDAAFITKPFKDRPDYITSDKIWSCETDAKWVTEDSPKLYYRYEMKPVIPPLKA